jgi:hypothetical protein
MVHYHRLIYRNIDKIMHDLPVQNTPAAPTLTINNNEGIIELKSPHKWGGSLTFYHELLEWTDQYIKNPKNTIVNVDLMHIDPSSAEWLTFFFKKLVKIRKKRYELTVNWYYHQTIENSKAYGYVFSKISKIRFNFIERN